MANDNTGGLKMYFRRKFSTGGGGITWNSIAYAEGETGIKLFADAVFASGAGDEIVIMQQGFEGGYATGQIRMSKDMLLALIEEILEELGFGTTGARQAMIFADYSGGNART
jgi:hypothetical protein